MHCLSVLSILSLICVATTVAISSASAQPYPAKPLRFILPFPPGGATDAVGRTIAERFSSAMSAYAATDPRAWTL